MPIKQLIQGMTESVVFSLGENEAVVVLNLNECLYIIDPSLDDLKKLNRFKGAKKVKFIGSEEIYKKISQECPSWKFINKIFETKIKVCYYSESGKIRYYNDNYSCDVKKKKVLIVDDSKLIQKLISTVVEKSSKLEVLGVASCPSEAREIIEKTTPDLITLDIHMPEMTGVEFLKTYLEKKSIPTVIISSVSIDEGPLVMEALSSGADTYIQKPTVSQIESDPSELIETLEAISMLKKRTTLKSNLSSFVKFSHFDGLIAIGSSTGGTRALQKVLTSMPESIPPIVIVQHIPAVFSKALAERLNLLCKFRVKEAEVDELIEPNTVYIAPGGKQMKVEMKKNDLIIKVTDDLPVNRFKPSVDYLFDSVAQLVDVKVVAAILTGMGKDGAKGLLKIKENNGITVAQDEQSSVVYGMPKEAKKIGAVLRESSLDDMSTRLVLEFNKLSKKKKAA